MDHKWERDASKRSSGGGRNGGEDARIYNSSRFRADRQENTVATNMESWVILFLERRRIGQLLLVDCMRKFNVYHRPKETEFKSGTRGGVRPFLS